MKQTGTFSVSLAIAIPQLLQESAVAAGIASPMAMLPGNGRDLRQPKTINSILLTNYYSPIPSSYQSLSRKHLPSLFSICMHKVTSKVHSFLSIFLFSV